jgi:hypothetical protein
VGSGARARGAQFLAQLARGLGQFLDHRSRVVAQRKRDPGQAPDQDRQYQCRTDAARHAVRL